MRCIVIDDEQLVRELVEDNIRQVPFLKLVGSCKNTIQANDLLRHEKVDLIFLDIQMPGISGLQFLKTLKDPPLVIIVTAYEKYALEGYALQVIDYLLKPFSFERFLKAANRAQEFFRLKENTAESQPESFFVNVEYTLVKIIVADIIYVESLKDYIKIYLSTSSRPVITRMTMKSLEQKLSPAAFIRTHKSFLVAFNKITAVKRDFVCIKEKEIPTSASYKKSIEKAMSTPGQQEFGK